MPAMHISRSIKIDASIEKVYQSISNFKEWPRWSPWLITEPDCKVTHAADGKRYSWDGQYVGSGEMSIIEEKQNESLNFDLQFLKPWKSTAKVSMHLKPSGDATELTWSMDSSLPIFMFFMKGMMESLVGMDYDRGLLMLKDLLETGEVPVNLEFAEGKTGPYTVVGPKTDCRIADISTSMENDIKKLKTWIDESDATPCGPMLSIYHKWNPGKGLVNYTIGFNMAEVPSELPENFNRVEIPEVTTFSTKLTGPYRHLGCAWSAGINRSRGGAFKQSRKVHPFEMYENSPDEVEENDLITSVHFPIR